jgi:hypothetical protein
MHHFDQIHMLVMFAIGVFRVAVSVVHDAILLRFELDSEDVNRPRINLNSERSISHRVSTASSHM